MILFIATGESPLPDDDTTVNIMPRNCMQARVDRMYDVTTGMPEGYWMINLCVIL